LALRESLKEWEKAPTAEKKPAGPMPLTESIESTLTLLQECLQADPNHTEALWCLAAVRSVLGDRQRLQELADPMDRPGVKDARFHFLAAVCHLAKPDYTRVLELSQRAATDESLAVECHYLMAWAHLHLRNPTAATQALQKVVSADKSPSAGYARALLGRLSYDQQAFDDAIKWWNQVDAKKRAEWKLDDPLRQTVLLAGLLSFQKGQYEQAAERFREAGKLGLRDRRLGSMLTLALVKAGQRLLFEQARA
jgi:tetratricopeptide (TPR) repeat protein